MQPGIIPAGTDDNAHDIVLYENSAAMVESGGKLGQFAIGTLIRVDNGWRVLGVPLALEKNAEATFVSMFQSSLNRQPDQPAVPADALTEETKNLIAKLGEAQKAKAASTNAKDREAAIRECSLVLRKLSSQAKDKAGQAVWIRQLADELGTSAGSGEFPDGLEELRRLHGELKKQAPEADLTAYVRFRLILADYSVAVQNAEGNFGEVQETWIEELKQFVSDYPASEDTPEALWQLGVAEEFAGNDEKALEWFDKILELKGNSEALVFRKAEGAKRRLTSVGKPLALRGKTPTGQPLDIQQFKGKLVLVHFWTTWSKTCVDELPILDQLNKKFGAKFLPVGVNLDQDAKQVNGFLQKNRIDWPQLFAPGGLDGPLAVDYGVSSVPTMILIDANGTVIDRNVNVADLQEYLTKKLR
jgi:thiol-disulfide isomerase/thioredoxin